VQTTQKMRAIEVSVIQSIVGNISAFSSKPSNVVRTVSLFIPVQQKNQSKKANKNEFFID
jgi:hypothetical protein